MPDRLDELLAKDKDRTVPFNPYRPAPIRPERSTKPAYADPTGNTAVGNIKKEGKS